MAVDTDLNPAAVLTEASVVFLVAEHLSHESESLVLGVSVFRYSAKASISA